MKKVFAILAIICSLGLAVVAPTSTTVFAESVTVGGESYDYDPNYDPCKLNVDAELAKKWLANGAQPTEVVGKLFKMAYMFFRRYVIAEAAACKIP